MRTILQKIGPLYGEPVNGTVFGQPNGSEYIPPKNFIEIVEDYTDRAYVKLRNPSALSPTAVTCTSAGEEGPRYWLKVSGQVPWKLKTEFSDDSEFSTVILERVSKQTQAIFPVVELGNKSGLTIEAGKTYYLRVSIVSDQSGGTMATLDTITLEGWTQ